VLPQVPRRAACEWCPGGLRPGPPAARCRLGKWPRSDTEEDFGELRQAPRRAARNTEEGYGEQRQVPRRAARKGVCTIAAGNLVALVQQEGLGGQQRCVTPPWGPRGSQGVCLATLPQQGCWRELA
jgi:hypothetical protein